MLMDSQKKTNKNKSWAQKYHMARCENRELSTIILELLLSYSKYSTKKYKHSRSAMFKIQKKKPANSSKHSMGVIRKRPPKSTMSPPTKKKILSV
jgi:hypothetical protein